MSERELTKKPLIISIVGKGGVGKTAITTLLARAISQSYDYKLLLIDADPTHPHLSNMLKLVPEKSLEDLKKVGADIDQIPKHELEEGDGTVFKAIRTWYNYLDLLQRNGRTRRIDDLEDLRLRMDAWRMDVAAKYRIAPSDAMPDHL